MDRKFIETESAHGDIEFHCRARNAECRSAAIAYAKDASIAYIERLFGSDVTITSTKATMVCNVPGTAGYHVTMAVRFFKGY